MEPVEKPVRRKLKISYTVLMTIGPETDADGFTIVGLGVKFMATGGHFQPGDRVKITITKEPLDANAKA